MPAKVAKPLSGKEKLAQLKKSAKPVEKKASKTSIRVVEITDEDVASVGKLCEFAYLVNQIDPLFEQSKSVVQDVFFERWTKEMWESRNLPENFKARIKKCGADGKSTGMDDMACNFVLKFRTDGLKGKLPKPADMPEDKTVQEILIETLQSVAGLSPDNAQKFVAEEVLCIDKTNFPDTLAGMLEAEEGSSLAALGNFLVSCVNAKSSKELAKIVALTDEQREAAIQIDQTVHLKDGVEERLLSYVENLEQLRNLLNYMSVTKQVSNFEFGISDEVDERNARLTEIAKRFINLTK